jgi:hypothetical protein
VENIVWIALTLGAIWVVMMFAAWRSAFSREPEIPIAKYRGVKLTNKEKKQ